MVADILYSAREADDPIADVRALIPDIEQLTDPSDPAAEPAYIFDDATLTRYLRLNGGSVKLATADACEALGTSEGLILKVITQDDQATNGAALMAQYGAKATRLRTQAAKDDATAGSDAGIIAAPFRGTRRPWL